jgi:uncharacterized protein (DUF2147 family)
MSLRSEHLVKILAAATLAIGPASADPMAIIGHWRTDNGAAIVAIDRCGARLCGTIVRVLDPDAPRTDINNPVQAMRSRPLVGTRVLSDFQVTDGQWRNGRAYDPKSGRSYRSSLRLADNDLLSVTGCVAFFCRTRSWTRSR